MSLELSYILNVDRAWDMPERARYLSFTMLRNGNVEMERNTQRPRFLSTPISIHFILQVVSLCMKGGSSGLPNPKLVLFHNVETVDIASMVADFFGLLTFLIFSVYMHLVRVFLWLPTLGTFLPISDPASLYYN